MFLLDLSTRIFQRNLKFNISLRNPWSATVLQVRVPRCSIGTDWDGARKKSLGVLKTFYILIWVVVTHTHMCVSMSMCVCITDPSSCTLKICVYYTSIKINVRNYYRFVLYLLWVSSSTGFANPMQRGAREFQWVWPIIMLFSIARCPSHKCFIYSHHGRMACKTSLRSK